MRIPGAVGWASRPRTFNISSPPNTQHNSSSRIPPDPFLPSRNILISSPTLWCKWSRRFLCFNSSCSMRGLSSHLHCSMAVQLLGGVYLKIFYIFFNIKKGRGHVPLGVDSSAPPGSGKDSRNPPPPPPPAATFPFCAESILDFLSLFCQSQNCLSLPGWIIIVIHAFPSLLTQLDGAGKGHFSNFMEARRGWGQLALSERRWAIFDFETSVSPFSTPWYRFYGKKFGRISLKPTQLLQTLLGGLGSR